MKDLLIIYLAGMTGIFKAIPVGIMLQASPVWIALMTAFGGLTAAAVLYHFGGWVQQMMKKMGSGFMGRMAQSMMPGMKGMSKHKEEVLTQLGSSGKLKKYSHDARKKKEKRKKERQRRRQSRSRK